MAYAGRIGHPDGVKIYIERDETLRAKSEIEILYYAWNNKALSNPGYGTKDITIKATFSPTRDSAGFRDEEFALIKNSGNGNGACELKVGDILACGTVVKMTPSSSSDKEHRYMTLTIKLNPEMQKKLTHTVSLLRYSAMVNDHKSFNEIAGLLIEKR